MAISDLQSARSQLSGAAVTHSSYATYTSRNGVVSKYVADEPAALASSADCDLDTYSLARVLASEGYGGGADGYAAALVAIGQASLNVAARNGLSITAQCVKAHGDANGHYGQQTQGREFATTEDPTAWHIECARQIRAGEVPDLAFGAHQYLDPSVWASRANSEHPLEPFSTVITRWHDSYKWAWAGSIPSVNPFYLMLFYPEGDEETRADSLKQCLEIYAAGKSGNSAAPGNPDALDTYDAPDGVFNTVLILAMGLLLIMVV